MVLVVGGANVDVKARTDEMLVPETSNPGTVMRSPGGVGRNVAENLARLGTRVSLVTAVGADADGAWLLGETAAAGVTVSHSARVGRSTGAYVAVVDADGELVAGVSDMAAVEALTPDLVPPALVASAALVVVDGNLPVPTVAHVLDAAAAAGVRVVLDPVSVRKAERISTLVDGRVFAVTPNQDELAALGSVADLHRRGVEVVWVRRGPVGSLLSSPDGEVALPAPEVTPVDVTGAGDAMLAAFCHRLLAGHSLVDAAAYGHEAAALTVASPHTVRPDLRARMAP
jgi:sugar/nucleoside kinase (ribokinase family)